MPVDRCGRNLHPRQLVDIHLNGMYQGQVQEIKQPRGIVVPGHPPQPGMITLLIGITVPYQGAKCDSLYVTHTPKSSLLEFPAEVGDDNGNADIQAPIPAPDEPKPQ